MLSLMKDSGPIVPSGADNIVAPDINLSMRNSRRATNRPTSVASLNFSYIDNRMLH